MDTVGRMAFRQRLSICSCQSIPFLISPAFTPSQNSCQSSSSSSYRDVGFRVYQNTRLAFLRTNRSVISISQIRFPSAKLGISEPIVEPFELIILDEPPKLEVEKEIDPTEAFEEPPEDAFVLEGNGGQKLRRLPGSNIFVGSNIRNIQVKQAEFIKSSPNVHECPKDGLPEFAVVGRSNVGKSSLINALVRRKDIAQTSKKPGKTQLINHFLINKSWYLVDLPGYGYAKAPISVRTDWNAFTKDYFLNRKTLLSVMLLVDASIPAQQIDFDCANWLGKNEIPITLVFTKCDKRKKKKNGGKRAEENVNNFLEKLKESFSEVPPWVCTSCVSLQGRDELLVHMAQLRQFWRK